MELFEKYLAGKIIEFNIWDKAEYTNFWRK
ncbi:hypothetical protein M948_21075 [Virgibacillus sp. CM-4]|nr:hypothetical protein M948_21075 [Virgibacillus sp. CM-4]